MRDQNFGKVVLVMRTPLKERNSWWENLSEEQRKEHAMGCVVRHNAQTGNPHKNPEAIRQSVLTWLETHPEWNATVSGEKNLNWRGGRSYETRLKYQMLPWRRRAGEIRRRDNNTCQTCRQVGDVLGNRLEVNHLDGDFWNWLDSNLLTQCERDHRKADAVRRIAKLN